MRVARFRLKGQSTESDARIGAIDAWTVRFGDEILVYSSNRKWPRVAAQAARLGLKLEEHSQPVSKSDIYLVLQKGRLFQKAYPDIPILIDKGRYLAVELSPEEAEEIRKSIEPCFSVRAIKGSETVFEAVPEPTAAQREGQESAIQQLVDSIDASRFEDDLHRLASYHTRLSSGDEYHQAALWARDRLHDLGYNVVIQQVPIPGQGGQSYNIIADKAGIGPDPRKIVLVVAHLDSVNHEDGAFGAAPGADDNASGSAGALEIARVLKEHTGARDLRLILFGGEEQGLFGSKNYVNGLSIDERSRIGAVVNMDMIGTLNRPPPSVLIEGAPVSQDIIDGLTNAAAVYTSLDVEVSLNYWGSDHAPFIDAGLPAVLTIEGADQININEHTARDTPDRIDIGMALEILRMNTAFVGKQISSG